MSAVDGVGSGGGVVAVVVEREVLVGRVVTVVTGSVIGGMVTDHVGAVNVTVGTGTIVGAKGGGGEVVGGAAARVVVVGRTVVVGRAVVGAAVAGAVVGAGVAGSWVSGATVGGNVVSSSGARVAVVARV